MLKAKWVDLNASYKYDLTTLHQAAACGRIQSQTVELLMSKGADVVQNPYIWVDPVKGKMKGS